MRSLKPGHSRCVPPRRSSVVHRGIHKLTSQVRAPLLRTLHGLNGTERGSSRDRVRVGLGESVADTGTGTGGADDGVHCAARHGEVRLILTQTRAQSST